MMSEKLCYTWLIFYGNSECSKPVANASIAKKLFQKKKSKKRTLAKHSIYFISANGSRLQRRLLAHTKMLVSSTKINE